MARDDVTGREGVESDSGPFDGQGSEHEDVDPYMGIENGTRFPQLMALGVQESWEGQDEAMFSSRLEREGEPRECLT